MARVEGRITVVSMPAEQRPTGRSSLTGWRARVVVLLLSLSPFIALEVVLRATGYGRDAFTNFAPDAKVYVVEGDLVKRDPMHGGLFRTPSFTLAKPSGTTRIFVIGDSVTYGFTYHSREPIRTDPLYLEQPYSSLLQKRLEEKHPGRRFEVINCGGLGHASFRLVGVVREVLGFSPDLVIVMTGSSEFMEARTYKDWKEIRDRRSTFLRGWRTLTLLRNLLRLLRAGSDADGQALDDRTVPARRIPVSTDDEVRGRYEVDAQVAHSTHNLQEMIAACQGAGVPLVLCTIPSDLTHPPHYRGEAPPESGLPVPVASGGLGRDRFDRLVLDVLREEKGRFGRAVALIQKLNRQGDHEEAVQTADAALEELEDDLRVGVLHYLKGMALIDLKRPGEARKALKKARDLDLLPLRGTGEFNDVIRDLCARPGVFLAEVELAFERASPDGIPGQLLFFDNCHPVGAGHDLIAETILSVLDRNGLLPD